jgi:DnaJ-class molecular chaperone
MSAPNPCRECGGSGWVRYMVETVEGEEEWAWSLCPECEGGDAFPPKEGEIA